MSKPHATPQTTFAGSHNPFTGAPITMADKPTKPAKPVVFIDPATLKIANDPLPKTRAPIGLKYGKIFAQLKPGQCIVCQGHEADKLGNNLRTWLKRGGKIGTVKATRRYTDGLGRVWLLA